MEAILTLKKCEKLHPFWTSVCTSAGESPFQNGVHERVHYVSDMMLTKLEQDYKDVNEQSLLCWAYMARNVLQMWNRFSSHQLVFGWSPNLPNIMTDKLPALEGRTVSKTFDKHLNLLHNTRRAYIEAEADKRIRRTLLNKVRAAEQCYENGDLVYYNPKSRDRRLRAGTVVFQNGKKCFCSSWWSFCPNVSSQITKSNRRLYPSRREDNRYWNYSHKYRWLYIKEKQVKNNLKSVQSLNTCHRTKWTRTYLHLLKTILHWKQMTYLE